jgi:hypothetical protein
VILLHSSFALEGEQWTTMHPLRSNVTARLDPDETCGTQICLYDLLSLLCPAVGVLGSSGGKHV